MPTSKFDKAYYDRFYADQTTRAVSPAEQRVQARFVAAYLLYLQVPVRSILDVGCGLGVLLEEMRRLFPKASTTGIEFSPYLCETYGWEEGSVVDFVADKADLVICHDVLAYLTKPECAEAIDNLAHHTRQVLYLSVITKEDMAICDVAHTDMQQKLRPAQWYRKQLVPHFESIGGGLYLRKPVSVPVWQLERGG